ncbi:golgin subfamily B member 1-like [Pocillopora verrucosa]|uniref:golgin subfamily B member 1-like n=1 Tax=Pocillopora verrucosa TaxID=203993 RepID=UPI003342E05F
MASWLHPEKKSNQNLLPPLRQKSRIPVRVTHLSSESKGSLDEKALLHRDSDRKLQNKRPSRIPIVVDEKKNKVDTKENLPVYFKIQGEEPLGKHSGIKLKDTQGKEEKKKASTISSTAAKYGSYRRAKETMPNVRRRIPRQLTPLETDSKQVCSDEKEPREESSAGEVSSSARTEDVTPDFECNVAPVLEEELRIGAEADFSGSEFGDDFERHSKSSDEKAMPNVPPWLREECKKREEITLNKNIVKDDTAVTNAAQNIRLEPELDTEDKVDKCGLSEEELDCSSFTESSGYKRKMAELDEKSRRLKAQFAEENRQAIESMNKIVEEIKQSQAREDSITNDIQEMRRRQDEIKDDLKRLDEIGQRRELEDKKWRERIEKKKKKVARRLEKIRAERRKYQEETADEDGSTEEHEQPDENLNENREGEKCKHVTMENKTVVSEEIDDNKVLYEPHEIKEYKSVKELEKKRKKLRRLERLEKKAIKREKLEQRERKKIEKQKRKVARKLEKLSGKTSKISEGTSEASKCKNQPMEASNTTTKENLDETPRVSKSKPCTDKTSDGKESKQVQAAHFPGLPTNGVEVEKIEEKLAEVENKQHIASDSGAPAKVGWEKESYSDAAKKKEKACNYPDEQIKRIDDNTDAEVVSAGREDTLDDISIEELGLEEALNFDQETKGEIQMGPENRDFLSDNSGSVLSRTGCQEPFRQEKEKRPQGEPVAMSHVSYFPSPDCSKHDEYRAADEPVYEDVSVSNCEKNNGFGDYKRDLFSSFSPVTDQTSPLTRKTSGRFTSFDLQPLCRSPEMGEENPVMEDSHSNVNELLDSERTSQNYRNEEVPLQLENRSTENKENSGEDQSQLMSKGSHNHSDETPEQVKCPVTYQTAPLTRKVSERFTPFCLQLSWRSPEMVENNLRSENSDSIVDESVKSEHIDQNDSNEEVPRQLEKISPENRENDIQDQSQLMREESHSHSDDTFDLVNHRVTNQTTPFTTFALQPFCCLPEEAEDNQILQDTDSTVDKLVDSEHSNKKYSNEEVPQQLENRFAEHEVKSNKDDANHTTSSDILEDFQGTLSESRVPCPDNKTDKDTDSEISCGEETRRLFKTDPFANFVKEAGDESRTKKALAELIQEELISTLESPAKCSLAVENGNNNERPLKGKGSPSHKDDICDQFKDRDQFTGSSFHSPELGVGNEKLEVTASTTNQLEGNKENEPERPNLEDLSYMTTNNIKSYNDANDTSCNDIPEELEEILLVSGVSSHTEEESVYETDVQVICKEEDSCASSSDALSTSCRGDISMGAYEIETERRKENVLSDGSGQMYNVDDIIDDTETAVIPEEFRFENRNSFSEEQSEHWRLEIENTLLACNYEKEQLEKELAEKEDKSCNDVDDTVYSDRPKWIEMGHTRACREIKTTPDNSSFVQNDDKTIEGLKNIFQTGEKQKMTENKENHWKEAEVLVKYSDASFDDKKGSLSSIDDKGDSVLQQHKTKVCKKRKKVSDDMAKFSLVIENSIEDEFIDDFDRFLDEVEEDILTKESMSQISHSVEKEDDEKNVDECGALPSHERSVAAVVNTYEYLFQSFSCSPEEAEDNQILQDTDFTVEKLVNSEHSNKKYSNEEVPQQLENRFAGNEVRSNNDDANHTTSSDILEGFEGTLSERTAPCSDDKTDKDTDSEISCSEETRRPLKTDLFSDVIKEAGDESLNKKALTELIQEELISSSESPAKCSLAVENGNNNERPLKGEGSSSHKDDICDQFKDRDQLTSSSFPSPELGAGNEKLEVTASTTDQLEGNKKSVRKQPNLKDSSYMTTNNIKSYNDANDTSCNDIPEELEEILLVSGVSSHTEEESVYETDVQVICKEEDSCTSSSDALSTSCRGDISMGAYETKTERRKENVVSDESGQMYNVDNIIDDTETAVIPEEFRFEDRTHSFSEEQSEHGRLEIENTLLPYNYEKEPQQLEKELAGKEDKSCNNADDAVHSDRPRATPDNSSSVQSDDKAREGSKNIFQTGEKQKMTENKENYWKEAEVLVKYSDASFDDKKGSLSSIDDKGDSVLQQHKTKVCNFDSLNDKKRKKVSDDMAKFSPDKENSIEDEFIEDFDRFLDEVEEDILTEESMSQISHSAVNECSSLPSYERSVAAVVNISEYLFQQEFSKALETTIPDSKKEYTSQSEKSSEEELELEKRKYLAKDVYRSEDVSEYRYVIGIALDKLNHINSVLTDAGEQFLDRRIKHGRCAVHGDIDSGTRLLNSIDVLNDNVKGAVKDFKLAIQMTEVEPKFHKENDVVKLGQIRKENTELEIQINVIKEELETYQKRIENLQADLDESKDEVRRLQLKEEYKEREVSNLKRDIQSKERKWEEGNETVEKVMGDIKELWDDVDFLEESLKNSQKSNEDLMFQVDELKKTIKEMKKEYWMEHSRGGCGHLREEVELLNGSLELKEQRLVLLEGQQARQFSQHAVKDKELSELKDENLRVVSKLEDQLAKLSRENSALTTELLKVSGKDDQVGEVKDETSSIIKHLRKVKVDLSQENYTLTSELSQALVENESLKKANSQVSNMMRQFEDELARLKKEHSMTDLRAASDENNRWNGIKEETFGVVRQLENKISRLLEENLTIAVKLSEESEHKTQLNELKCETTKTISDLNDEIAKLQREKSILSSELSAKESDKNNQLYELRCEKWKIERKLEGEITDLSRENSTLTARLSKASETNDKLKELREQLELKVQLKNLTEAAEAFMKSKAKEVEEANCCIKEQDETIKNLLEEIRQERCDKDRRVLQSERIGELETQLQRMEEMKRSTVHRIDALVLEVRKQRSEKERLKRVIEAKECTCCEDKDLMKITENQENQLRKKDDLTNATLTLNNNKRSLQEANSTIDMLHKQLEREKSDNENLRRALKASEYDTNERNRLTQKIEKLENQLQEMDDLRENTLRSLQGKEWSLEEASNKIKELTREIAREKSDKEYFKKKVDAGENTSNRLKLVKKETIRKAEQTGCLMAQVGKGLRNLVQRQREVYASSLIMKKTEAYTASVVEKLRKDLNEREESVEYLRSCSQDSANECSFMRRLLEDIQCENAHLRRCLGDKDEKVRMLETIVKQLEEDLQKTQKYLKEKEVGFVDANETLRLKCSLLTTMEAKLCLRNKEIDELTQTNKEKSLELTRIETTLREVKKELDIAASIIEKQNEQCTNLKNCAMRKTRDAEEMHDELKRLSTQLVCSKEEKSNLHRAVLVATSRLEYESKQFWDMKMDLREAAARISVLEDEKAEQEENLAAFKGKVSRELDLLKETRHEGNEESSSLQLTIGSAEREIAKLTKENQKQFRIELLHNGLENKSSESSCEKSTFRTLETTRGNALAASSQGDTQSKWVNNSRFEKRFETRGDNRFNRTGTITARGSSNTVSILLYNG